MNRQRDSMTASFTETKTVLDRAVAAALGAGDGQLTDVVSWHAHVPFAHALIVLLAPDLVVELGVHQGDSLLSMAQALHRFGQRGRVVGIDTWRGDDHAGAYDGSAVLDGLMTRAAAFGPRVTLLRSTFDDALHGFADGSIDLLHIDGLHTYDAVRHDFETWRPKLSSRAVVMFHDTAVTTGDFGVYRLWDEVRGLGPSHGFAFGNGLGVLALGPDVPETVVTLLAAISAAPGDDGLFAAIGEAMEGRSLRQVLTRRAQGLETEIETLHGTASAEIARLNAEIAATTTGAKDRIEALDAQLARAQAVVLQEQARLEAELENTRAQAGAEIERLNALIAQERDLAASTMAGLDAELATTRQTAGAEIERLNAQIAQERDAAAAAMAGLDAELATTRQTAHADVERLNTLIAQEKDLAASTVAGLQAQLRAAEDNAAAEVARLTAEIEDQRRSAGSEQLRLENALAEARETSAQLTAALDAEQRETARQSALLQDAQARVELLRREAEANRLAAEDLADASAARALAAETALASERDLSRTALDLLKQKVVKSGRDLGLVRASLTRETKRSETRSAEVTRLAALHAEAEQHLAALRAEAAEAGAETARLAGLIAQERAQAQAEIARLDALVDADRQSGQAEIDRLNREIAILHRDYTAALERARLKSRAVRLFKKVAMPAFRLLPLPRRTKQRLRLAIVNRYGAALQLVPPKTPALATQTQLALRHLSPRYLPLARASTGTPANLPPRSVSIIIPVYNQIEYTLRCIDAIKLNTTDIEHEIIVVDDCSSDMTEIVLSPRSDILYIRNEQNLGFIGSCNAGLARAGKTYVCYLNNDTEVTPVWLSSLVDTFELHPGVGLAGSQLIYPDGRLQEAGGIIWDDFSGWNWGRLQDPEAPRYTYARMADYCSGAAILLPRALADSIGGFDPEFTPAYGEDSDMAFRLRAMGLATVYQPLSRVVHYEGISSGTDTTKGVKAYQVVNAAKLKDRWAHVLPHHGANGVDPDRAVERGRIGRVLVIDQITPEPDKDAGSITALELMLAMRDLGYKVSFIPCSNFTYIPDYTDLLGSLGIESVLHPWARSVEDHLLQAADAYEAVVIFRVNTATDHLATIRRLAPRAKIIFHNSDLHFLREERARMVDNPNVAERQLSPETTKGRELSIIAGADVTIVHSHFEAELLAEFVPQVPVVVFPWVYEPRGAGAPLSQRRDVVFLGGYRHYPNVDAVLHYARDVSPVLAERLPEVRFRAIGSNPTDEMLALASDRLVIEGFIDDLGPVLSKARVMLVPLRYGAGLKGKIVTAMAHGLPVVTTSVGAEGMALTHGENVLVADTPEDMANAVARLYTDEALWKRLSAAGLAFVAATTSRLEGHRIIRQILHHAGLPALPDNADSPDPTIHHAQIGTPAGLRDAGVLANAARQTLGLPPDADITLLVPQGKGPFAPASAMTLPGLHLCNLGAADGLAQSGPSVLLVDAFDDAALASALSKLGSSRPEAILFLPPRLAAGATGFTLCHTISGAALGHASARTPVHLRHAAALAALGRPMSWQTDTSITGFPGMTILRLG